MTNEPKWISKKALRLLHEESLAEFGGARGLREEGPPDSALARPQNAYAYKSGSTLADLAASYEFGIAKNHAFIDGNKRAAFLSIGLFLMINGHRLVADQADAIGTMLGVASGDVDPSGFGRLDRRKYDSSITHPSSYGPDAGKRRPLAADLSA